MYLVKSFLCCGLLLLFVVSANAQNDRTRIGFGVGFGQGFSFIGSDLSVLALPIDFADFSVVIRGSNFRFEPTLGYFSISSTGSSNDFSNFRLGTILAYTNSRESMNFYYGIDIGVILTSEGDRSKTDFFIGPAIGGEYMFSNNFSLGGEIQINYISIGNFNESSDESTSMVSSRGKIILRWYVN